MSNSKKLYTIGDMSKTCGVPIKTLRYYDEINLLMPCRRNTETNYRYYTESQMLILHNIKKLQNYGFSLEEIREIIDNGSLLFLEKNLDKKLNEIHVKIDGLQNLFDKIKFEMHMINMQNEFTNKNKTSEGNIPTGIKIENIPEKKLLFTRRIEKNYENSNILTSRWFEMFNLIRKNGLDSVGSLIEIYNNLPLEQFMKKDCDVEVAIPISSFTGDYPFFKTKPAFKAVTALHSGNYENIISTHVTALKWLNQNGFEVCGPIMQEYIISPIDVKNKDEFLTKIIIPVKDSK